MSRCDYCGEKVGWFQNSHPACVARAEGMGHTVKKLVVNGSLAGRSYEELSIEVQRVLKDSKVLFKYVREALLQGINDAASQMALQSPISDEEFSRLVAILQGFEISDYSAEYADRRWFGFAQLGMSSILWQVIHHKAPFFEDAVEFNLRPDEIPIFQTGNCVTYAEERTVSNHVRSFGGLSLPVGGGIYYHIGGSQGHQERTSGLLPLDGGKMLITSHALYFGGQKNDLKDSSGSSSSLSAIRRWDRRMRIPRGTKSVRL